MAEQRQGKETTQYHSCIDESFATSGAERTSKDIAKVSKVLQEVLKVPCSITKAFRIGKKKDKPRLLKVSVQSLEEKTNIL